MTWEEALEEVLINTQRYSKDCGGAHLAERAAVLCVFLYTYAENYFAPALRNAK